MTFKEIKDKMGQWLGIPATDTRRLPDAARGEMVNDRHREIARRARWRWIEAKAPDIGIVAGQAEYALPLDWSLPISLKLHTPDAIVTLEPLKFDEFDARFPDLEDQSRWGTPVAWTTSGSVLIVGPCPSSVGGVLVHRYQKVPAYLVNDDDQTDITKQCGDSLKHLSIADACAFILEPARAQWFLDRGETLLQQELSINARRVYDATRPISEEA